MWVIKVASISACLRYTVIDITSGSNRCSNRYVIIVHLDREKNRHYYHVPLQESTSNRDERIGTYPNVYAGICATQIGNQCREFGSDQYKIGNSI